MNDTSESPQDELWRRTRELLGPDPEQDAVDIPISRRRRRAYRSSDADARSRIDLLRAEDGVLHWMYTPPVVGHGAHRRSWRSSVNTSDEVVQSWRRPLVDPDRPSTTARGSPAGENAFSFDALGRNALIEGLIDLDERLTPDQGLKRWDGRRLVPHDQDEIVRDRTLLLVHGTFSKSQMFFDELKETAAGRTLLARWQDPAVYGRVLAFDHATLSVGAWSNAIDLAGALRNVNGPIDVICHSRGGLVVSWALRLRPLRFKRVVFVGSPLTGTSLASPERLRGALHRLANFADAAAAGGCALSGLLPFSAGAAGLAALCGGVLRLGDTPLTDAAVVLVPGLASQQRIRFSETRQLFGDTWLSVPRMYGLGCNFEPLESNQPLWKFWRRFTHIGDQVKHAGADLVFQQPNDLVVDVASMEYLGEARSAMKMQEFKALTPAEDSHCTHHTNYFRNTAVLETINRWLT